MLDKSDKDYEVAVSMYMRCAFEALKALRRDRAVDAEDWVNLANALDRLWTSADGEN